MDSFLQDVKFAAKVLFKDKGFALTAILTLGLVLAANTTIFTVVDSVLLRPLPVPEADEIVLIYNSYSKAGSLRAGSSVPHYFERLEGVDVFDEIALFRALDRNVKLDGRPERVNTMEVTPSFFRLLGVEPRLGRVFLPEEGEVGQEKKAVLSYGLWQQLYGGSTACLGETLEINGEGYEIVGVMPEGFRFAESDVRLWTSVAFTEEQKSFGYSHRNDHDSIARLKDGATVEQAQAQVDAINAANMERFPSFAQLLSDAGFHTVVTPYQEDLVRDVRATLYLLWAGVAGVLLIGCVNVLNLVLVRSSVRLKELATRAALGAGRLRIARQMLTESILLTLLGAGVGLAVGRAGLAAVARLGLDEIPRGDEIAMSPDVLLYTVGLAVALGLILALIPLAATFRADLHGVLREEGRGGTSGRGARLLRRALVTAQVAFAFLLLIGSGLLLASFQKVLDVAPGFDPEQVLTATVQLPAARYPESMDVKSFSDRALAEIRALPGVTAAGTNHALPFSGNDNENVIVAEGYVMAPGESIVSPAQSRVAPGYFEAMGIPLVAGRFFDESDNAVDPNVEIPEGGDIFSRQGRTIIVDEKLAKKFWGDESPLGRRLFFPTNADLTRPDENTVFMTVVGVVGTVRQRSLAQGDEPVGTYYLCSGQWPTPRLTFVVKTATTGGGLAKSLRDVINRLDPELPLFDTRTMEERLADSLTSRRSPMILVTAFGGVALGLAALGIYGVLAYLVTQRTREIGIRMALGGQRGEIFNLVMREGLTILAAGLLIGGVAIVALRGLIASQLYGIGALDPRVLTTVAMTLVAISVAACALPAARATRIHPIVALHE